MKDHSVAPAGLFAPERQRRLIDALVARFETCQKQRQELINRHAAQRDEEEQQLLSDRSGVTAECRRQRRITLGQWDAAEEKVFTAYEEDTVRLRTELNRLASLYRRKSAEGKLAIERKVEARREAVLHQFEVRRHQPGEQSKKEIEQINASLVPLSEDVAWARDLTIRRLDRLPNVPPPETPEEDMSEPTPESIKQAIDTVYVLSRKCRGFVTELQTSAAAKFDDSFYLPGGVAVAVVLWCIGVQVAQPDQYWVYMISGVVAAALIGFAIYAALLIPLRRQTRRTYPLIMRTAAAAEEAAAAGRKISKDTARDALAELEDRRDRHLEAAKHWREEQLEYLAQQLAAEQQAAEAKLKERLGQLGDDFLAGYGKVNSEMHHRAEQVAATITEQLADTDQALHRQREANARRRHEELQRVTDRMRDGVRGGLERIKSTGKACSLRFPSWDKVAAEPHTECDELDFVPLGHLKVSEFLARTLTSESVSEASDGSGNHSGQVKPIFRSGDLPDEMPVALHRRLHSGLIIHAAADQMPRAVDLVHQVLWRMLSGTSGGRTKLTLIDPIGRGQSFTSFMSLADHDPSLVSHRVWTTENQIETRLGEIAQHAEDVLQSSLRDQFQRVEDYNQIAGSMAEPYQAVAAVGFPEGLTRGGYKHLKALIESGIRCGVFVLMVCKDNHAWPSDLPLPHDSRVLELAVGKDGRWSVRHEGLERLEFLPAENVAADLRGELTDQIGTAATMSARVEIPLESILPAQGGKARTDDGIDITIGSQGGQRTLGLELGEGVRQHVLIAGKTGSGKSTLLHSIITSGAHHYTPDQLQFYLLDFKKGVEFKTYADSRLPHARVIGIESEREFGRSVLQRLDQELQQRGELFRSQSTQELSDYRAVSGKPMPRIILVIDEFQELFIRDDRVAADCSMLLDRLVRQGRSFGIHVVLSSQSLAGAYSLPRATLGQMAVRIAMQCSESDAALILSDDNTAARLITRPGEAIYNDAGGLIEGNQPFQVAWLSSDQHREFLTKIATRDKAFTETLPPPVIFEGNRPCKWSAPLAAAAIGDRARAGEELHGLLGEAVEIGPPVAIELSRNAGRNAVMITPPEARGGLLSSVLSGFAKSNRDLEVIYFNGNRSNETPSLYPWLQRGGFNVRQVKPRDSAPEMGKLAELVKERGDEAEGVHPIIVVIDPLDRFRDFRHEDAFSFSLDATQGSMSGGQALREVLKDGPPANVYCVLVCGGAEILTRWLPRQSQHDVELRVLGQLNASDSSLLIDSPVASELSAATMLLYDEPAGRISKFRQPDQADAMDVKAWLES
ncbi:FtsK-like domain-containing protein [Stieleria maiorica]|uniref:FtsK-like domain-containing protein n=1 Tax=Stieleria maiorica TaxID=2795974 RepID=A0A5B9MQY0_9BACT|nr:FtsK/SpoIIIE domain-containing protein [Stieleria maiorica]QEG02275.1 FtsK-like domain-containing protein [Stieleria maiorica]